MKSFITTFYQKYKHIIPLLVYGAFYLSAFVYLEHHVTTSFHEIHMAIDDKIPFIEYFVVPYFSWFVYIASVVVFFFFKNVKEYKRLCVFLAIGMTVFLIVSYVYPNGDYLRPTSFEHDNIFTRMVATLYKADTATNLFPSIHVYNSLGATIALLRCDEFKNKKWIHYGSVVLCICIILSTVFIKQHSVFDVITGFGMAGIMYVLIYRVSWVKQTFKAVSANKINEKAKNSSANC